MANGNSRMAGKLASTCTTGWAKRDSLGLIPIFTPIGTQISVSTTTTTTTTRSRGEEAETEGSA